MTYNDLVCAAPSNFNPFVPNAHFLNPLKTSENRKVFLCFQGVEKACTGNKWINNFKFCDDYSLNLRSVDILKASLLRHHFNNNRTAS